MGLPPLDLTGLWSRAMRAAWLCFAMLAASLTTAWSDAGAVPRPRARAAQGARSHRGEKTEPPQSLGRPNNGHLAGAARLKNSRSITHREGAQGWALPALVKLLHRAADRVARKHRGSVLLVGDLSAKQGGWLAGHNSHQSGRDADVGFYVANSKGKPVNPKRFVAFDADGRAKDVDWARFDDVRNWRLVEALLEDRETAVHYIFVSNELKSRLLQAGTRMHASKDLLTRAAFAMLSPEHADLHDDHFHVRIHCPESMRSTCVEESQARSAGASGIGIAAARAGFDPSIPTSRSSDASGADSKDQPSTGLEPAKPGEIRTLD
jgi:penicillin-insensitive murein endopeptidase